MSPRTHVRKSLQFRHTAASCGVVGAILGCGLILALAAQGSATTYAEARQTFRLLRTYVLLPSMAKVLFTGFMVMATRYPYLDTRWAWLKALQGLSVFEATLGVIQSKATSAASEA
jgi:hypothetical protein